MNDWHSELKSRLAHIDAEGLRRSRKVLESPQSIRVDVNGRSLLNFSSNDYLGLANDNHLIEGFINSAQRWGVGSGSAHLVSGHSREHHALEEELAEFTGRDKALLFSTGYMANLALVSAFAKRGMSIYQDRLNHASLIDGALLSGGHLRRFPHLDTVALSQWLEAECGALSTTLTDGVFSMDGDLAPIHQLSRLSNQFNSLLIVDDAHGLGVLGAKGGGILEHLSISQSEVPLLMGTLGKAFGCFGAFVAGDALPIEWLLQTARTYLFTTAIPPAIAGAARIALKQVAGESWRRDHLTRLIQRFRSGARQIGLSVMDSMTPIQPVVIGSSQDCYFAGIQLMEEGFLVPAIRPPTVPKGRARLRVTLSAKHREEDVDALLGALSKVRGLQKSCSEAGFGGE